MKPGPKTKAIFLAMRKMQQNGWCAADMEHWEQQGWLGSTRPWT